MKIAAVQMNSGPEVQSNLDAARALLEDAARQGAAVALLPENFAIMGRKERDKIAVSEAPGSGPIQEFLSSTAKRLSLCIIGGTIPLEVAGETRVAPACVVYGADGAYLGRYDKIHLFDVSVPGRNETYRESASMVPGREPVILPTPAGRVGLSVCYDVRFPELYRRLSAGPGGAAQGADFLSVPAAFTVPTGEAHWDTLLRARAIENLCCVVAAAQVGEHANGRRTYGHSMIVDCWGTVLGQLPEGPGCVVAEFDLAKQAATRESFPALTHRVI
ncbi:MAG: carbon-nitrogen hydrolase family protein [Steroidobacteraceae bacterium]